MIQESDLESGQTPATDPAAHATGEPGAPEAETPEAETPETETPEDVASAMLDSVEARIVGSLIEKSLTTPEYYPMSLNALVNACNQKSNRDPVVAYDERLVSRSLENLRDKGLIRSVTGGDQRVPKYRHVFDEALGLAPAQTAVLCELLLRGPQTVGELRGRASRMHAFDELGQVQEVLDELAARDTPAAVRLPRQPGRKESRWAQLLTGAPDDLPDEAVEPPAPAASSEGAAGRLAALEETVANLQSEMEQLRAELAGFRQQFE
jgi:uncharacterized protein YceH (UPF0502 family)